MPHPNKGKKKRERKFFFSNFGILRTLLPRECATVFEQVCRERCQCLFVHVSHFLPYKCARNARAKPIRVWSSNFRIRAVAIRSKTESITNFLRRSWLPVHLVATPRVTNEPFPAHIVSHVCERPRSLRGIYILSVCVCMMKCLHIPFWHRAQVRRFPRSYRARRALYIRVQICVCRIFCFVPVPMRVRR